MAHRSPFLHSIVLTNANQEYNLLTLLQALDPDIPKRCQSLELQFDLDAAADRLYIGNPGTVGATDTGVALVASQGWIISSMDANLVFLSDIALKSNGASHKVNVSLITR